MSQNRGSPNFWSSVKADTEILNSTRLGCSNLYPHAHIYTWEFYFMLV